MTYELYYWPSIQGRGEFVRLALEEAGADYVDVARGSEKDGAGVPALMKLLNDPSLPRPPFAPPFLKAGDLIVAHTANILMYLGTHHGLVPADEAGRLWANSLQLSVTDFAKEIHDTHHPIASGLYYEQQADEAKRYTEEFLKTRLPKYLGYFEKVIERNDGTHAIGTAVSYVDLSLFQLIAGLRYAFPNAMARAEKDTPRLVALHDRVAKRPRIAAYLASPRRIPFNEQGLFRKYPELDG
jgi:glutathione S-transferase